MCCLKFEKVSWRVAVAMESVHKERRIGEMKSLSTSTLCN
jgi:hypothetical protein